jgi:hypothetical protein
MPSRKKINLENLKSNDKLRIKPKKKKKIHLSLKFNRSSSQGSLAKGL